MAKALIKISGCTGRSTFLLIAYNKVRVSSDEAHFEEKKLVLRILCYPLPVVLTSFWDKVKCGGKNRLHFKLKIYEAEHFYANYKAHLLS